MVGFTDTVPAEFGNVSQILPVNFQIPRQHATRVSKAPPERSITLLE